MYWGDHAVEQRRLSENISNGILRKDISFVILNKKREGKLYKTTYITKNVDTSIKK